MSDNSENLCQHVQQAINDKTALSISAGNSKFFYGHTVDGQVIDISSHHGIIDYDPTELVITVRAGTRLQEIEDTLASQGQMLGFEPPAFGKQATIGGTIACGLSGPARPFYGAARDFVLGTKIINGYAQKLQFGGQVIKNVAGYDVSRLQCGAMGTLGIILDVSLKVIPIPETTETSCFQLDVNEAIHLMNQFAGQPLPLTAACYAENNLYIRLAGNSKAVSQACVSVGGDKIADSDLWLSIREHSHSFFNSQAPLWRLSVPAATTPISDLSGQWLIDWGGALRWFISDAAGDNIRRSCQQLGGHAELFRNGAQNEAVFHPLAEPLKVIHKRLKHEFDPHGILNPGRMYPDW